METFVCKLIPGRETMTDAYFEERKETLNNDIPQFNTNPPTLSADESPWGAEIGSGIVGVYKSMARSNSAYYMVARAPADLAWAEAGDNKEKQLVAENMSIRNTKRLAKAAARSLGLQVVQIEDVLAKVSDPENVAKPLLAVQGPEMYKNKKVVYAGPYNGVSVFHVSSGINKSDIPTQTGKNTGNFRAYKQHQTQEFVWEKQMGEEHPELKDGLYKQVDAEFIRDIKERGWEQEGVDTRLHLIPVLVKLSNPNLKR